MLVSGMCQFPDSWFLGASLQWLSNFFVIVASQMSEWILENGNEIGHGKKKSAEGPFIKDIHKTFRDF